MDRVSAFGKNITYVVVPQVLRPATQASWFRHLSRMRLTSAGNRASFSPFAARTQQYVKEQLGQADEKVCV